MVAKLTKNNDEKLVKETSEELLKLIGVEVSCGVSYDNENKMYLLDIPAQDEAGLLIGKKGETINSFQVVLNQILRSKKGEWLRVVVNIADFREKEKNRMQELAQQTAVWARETGEPQNLYNLTASQRRTVHMTLSQEEDLQTVSVGEGNERYLIVSKK